MKILLPKKNLRPVKRGLAETNFVKPRWRLNPKKMCISYYGFFAKVYCKFGAVSIDKFLHGIIVLWEEMLGK